MSDQQRLDDATESLMRGIRMVQRGLDVLKAVEDAADAEASARCKAGDNATSADLREIAGMIQEGRAGAESKIGVVLQAYAKGRRLAIPEGGGVIVPFGGGS
jgi:hypothetical protein